MANVVSRQTGSFAWFGTSETVAITSVDPAKTIVQAQYRGTEAGSDRQAFSVELASATSLQFERIDRNGDTTIEWEVIEFDDAGLTVQHLSGLAIGANAITAVDLSRTVPISSGNTTLAGDDRARNYVELELTSTTALTARYRTGWPVAGVIAQVLELPPADVESLQVVSTAAVPFAAAITSVDETKTLTFGTGYADSTDQINNNGHGTLDLASATSLAAVRSDGTATAITTDYTAYILELTGSDVQRVSEVFSPTDLSLTAAISAVDDTVTSVFAGGWAGNVRWKQGDSLTTSANSEGAFTATLSGTTGVDFERGIAGTTGGSSSPLAQVVEWGSAAGPAPAAVTGGELASVSALSEGTPALLPVAVTAAALITLSAFSEGTPTPLPVAVTGDALATVSAFDEGTRVVLPVGVTGDALATLSALSEGTPALLPVAVAGDDLATVSALDDGSPTHLAVGRTGDDLATVSAFSEGAAAAPTVVVGFSTFVPTAYSGNRDASEPGTRIAYIDPTLGSDVTGEYYYWDGTQVVDSTTGTYGTDPLNPTGAIQPFATATGHLREGGDGFTGTRHPDWVLMKRGESFPAFGSPRNVGVSPEQPALIGAYGNPADPRPTIDISSRSFFWTSAGRTRIAYTVCLSLDMDGRGAVARERGVGCLIQVNPENLVGDPHAWHWFEDMRIRATRYAVEVQAGPIGDATVTLNRCYVGDTWDDTALNQGVYNSRDNPRVRAYDSTFYRNGYPVDPTLSSDPERNILDRNFYLGGGTQLGAELSGIISAYGGSGGPQLRHGGIMQDSLVIEGYWFTSASSNGTDAQWLAARSGSSFEFRDNVQLVWQNDTPNAPSTWGSISQPGNGWIFVHGFGGTFERNIISGQVLTDLGVGAAGRDAINLEGAPSESGGVIPRDVTVRDNIVYEMPGLNVTGTVWDQITGFEYTGNVWVDRNGTGTAVDVASGIADADIGTAFDAFSDNSFYTDQAAPFDGRDLPTWLSATGVTNTGNTVAARSGAAAAEGWTAPERTLKTYCEDVLGLTVTSLTGMPEFFALAEDNRIGAWDERLTGRAVVNYIREGFALPALSGDPVVPSRSGDALATVSALDEGTAVALGPGAVTSDELATVSALDEGIVVPLAAARTGDPLATVSALDEGSPTLPLPGRNGDDLATVSALADGTPVSLPAPVTGGELATVSGLEEGIPTPPVDRSPVLGLLPWRWWLDAESDRLTTVDGQVTEWRSLGTSPVTLSDVPPFPGPDAVGGRVFFDLGDTAPDFSGAHQLAGPAGGLGSDNTDMTWWMAYRADADFDASPYAAVPFNPTTPLIGSLAVFRSPTLALVESLDGLRLLFMDGPEITASARAVVGPVPQETGTRNLFRITINTTAGTLEFAEVISGYSATVALATSDGWSEAGSGVAMGRGSWGALLAVDQVVTGATRDTVEAYLISRWLPDTFRSVIVLSTPLSRIIPLVTEIP
jgi:hypothetical protein